jgi:hypothetical protein
MFKLTLDHIFPQPPAAKDSLFMYYGGVSRQAKKDRPPSYSTSFELQGYDNSSNLWIKIMRLHAESKQNRRNNDSQVNEHTANYGN